MSEAPAASRSRPAATVQVPPSARTTLSWAASRVTDGVVVTKRSGQKRRSYRVTRRLVEPTRRASRRGGGSGQKQTKYESETPPQGLRFANKASPIFVQTGARALRIVASSSPRSFPARLEANHSSTRAQSASESVTCRIADRHRALSHAPDVVKHGRRNLAFPSSVPAPMRDLAKGPGTNGVKISDAALRPIRRPKSNGNRTLGRSQVKSWRPKG